MADDDRRESGPTEHELSCDGWRVAAAAALGMFVSFASVLVYTFGIFLKPIAENFSWSREAVSGAFGLAETLGEPRLLNAATLALQSTLVCGLKDESHCLCHGSLGNIETIGTISRDQ